MPGNSSGGARATLGAALRGLRAREGLSGVALATRLGWPQSKVSRIETGRQLPTDDDISAWTGATGADADTVADLTEQLRVARTEHVHRQRGADESGQPARQGSLMDLAGEASLIRNFEVGVVPALLQTADYARVRLAEDTEISGMPNGDLESALLLRFQQQQVLYDSTKHFEFVVVESVLRTLLCPVDVMRGQLDRLTALLDIGNIGFGVIPAGSRLPLAPRSGFVMFDDEVVMETWTGQQTPHTTTDAARFGVIFDRLRDAARYGEQVRAIIADALAHLPITT
jgi:transcriptional regulator with XRE-family HTH domain